MSGLSRRKFLHASAAAGAAAVVGVPAARAVAGSSNHTTSSYSNTADHGAPSATGSFIVYVKDARKGQITVLNGENETVKSDPDLVRRIVRAASA
jgi:TAT (twin-arginine translocation) pathway signal sequence